MSFFCSLTIGLSHIFLSFKFAIVQSLVTRFIIFVSLGGYAGILIEIIVLLTRVPIIIKSVR